MPSISLRPSRFLILFVLICALVAGSFGARAQRPAMQPFRQSLMIEVPAAAGLAHCTLTASGYTVTTTRPNGTKYGTFYWTSKGTCDRNMVYLWTLGYITKLPATAIHRGSPGACGTDKLALQGVPGCRSVQMSGGSYYCDPCNGSWTLTAEFRMRFPGLVGTWSPVDCVLINVDKPGRFGCKTVFGSTTL